MLRVFLDNEWIEYNYSDLYSTRGYTDTPSIPLIIYDDNEELLEGWYNSGYNWIEKDHRWYPVIDTPYYVKQKDPLVLYKINLSKSYGWYINSNQDYVYKDNSFISVNNLHDTEGITKTPSVVCLEEEGVPIVWFNESENQYWYDKDKIWSPNPPVITGGGEYITTNPISISSRFGNGSYSTISDIPISDRFGNGSYNTNSDIEISYMES